MTPEPAPAAPTAEIEQHGPPLPPGSAARATPAGVSPPHDAGRGPTVPPAAYGAAAAVGVTLGLVAWVAPGLAVIGVAGVLATFAWWLLDEHTARRHPKRVAIYYGHNTADGSVGYVGQAVNPPDRWRSHSSPTSSEHKPDLHPDWFAVIRWCHPARVDRIEARRIRAFAASNAVDNRHHARTRRPTDRLWRWLYLLEPRPMPTPSRGTGRGRPASTTVLLDDRS